MFKNSTLYIVLVLLILSSSIEAQWVKCNGFSNEDVRSLITLGNNIYGGTIDNGVFISSDSGNSWTRTSLNNITVWAFVSIGNTLYAGTDGNGVFISTNNGINWTQTSLNNKAVLSLTTIGENIFAGTVNYGVYLSTNSGTSWTQTSLGNKQILAITTHGSNLYAGIAHDGIYMSTNMGTNWAKTSFPGDAWSFAQIDNNLFAGGFYGGVYLSTNGGTSWSQITLNGTTVYSMASSGNNIFAGTYQSGVYISKDKGVNWNEINQGFPAGIIVKAIQVKDGLVFAGTEQGVWRRLMSEITEVEKYSSEIPEKYSLQQNYPNPFNPITTINYSLNSTEFVGIKVFNTIGEEIVNLISEVKTPGKYSVQFSANSYSSGVYYYVLRTKNHVVTKSMLLLK